MSRKERRKMERQFRNVVKKISKKTGKTHQEIVNEMMVSTQKEIPLVPPPAGTSTIPSQIKKEGGLRSIFSKSIFGGITKKA